MRLVYLLRFWLLCLVFVGCKKKETLFLPIAPTDLSATVVSSNAVKLSWVDNSTNESGFKVERKMADGRFVEIGTVAPDLVAFTDSLLDLNVTYEYRVYAFSNSGKSLTYTNIASVSITTAMPTAVGEEPTDRTGRSMTFNAKVNAHHLPTTVTFEYGFGYEFNLSVEATPTIVVGDSLSSVSAYVEGLNAGSDYYYRVKATNALGTTYSDAVFAPTWGDVPYKVGQEYGGGVIFYLDESGLHGLIAAPNDLGQIPWSFVNESTGATDPAIGAGARNTQKIVEKFGPRDYAAYLCSILVIDGYDDWYLPSLGELEQLLYTQRDRIPSPLNIKSDSQYWSSTENCSETAYSMSLKTEKILTSDKPASLYVRAIRSF